MFGRKVIRDLLPPALTRFVNDSFLASQRYTGPYTSWADAAATCSGYSCPSILARVKAATQAVLNGEAAYEQDGVTFSEPGRPAAAMAPLLLAACLDRRLSVVDLGGALGTHYLRWKSFLSEAAPIKWQVIEQSHYVACGRALHSDEADLISFHTGIHEVTGFNAVLASSALQFFPNPMTMLEALVESRPRVLILERTPFGSDGKEAIFVQRVPPRIYRARYPVHALSWPALSLLLSANYRLISKYKTEDEPIRAGAGAEYWGAAWLRRD